MTRAKHSHNPPHNRKDQDLLLLAHGALSFWPRLRVQAHLRRCPACQERFTQIVQASAALAEAVRGPGLPAWSQKEAVSRAVSRRPPWQAVLAVLILVVLVLVTALFFAAQPRSALSRRAAPASDCRPDLPNSRCR